MPHARPLGGILSSQFSILNYRRGAAGGLIEVWWPRLGGGESEFRISDFGFSARGGGWVD
jgi:hypothetical protein